jgi:hypothetical protein
MRLFFFNTLFTSVLRHGCLIARRADCGTWPDSRRQGSTLRTTRATGSVLLEYRL